MIFEVTEADFMQRVVERSREVPVVVDFWAPWCGPCRQLTPALENAARARDGDVDLAKLNTDDNQQLAAAFRIQGIPAVKAFRDGQVVDEFTGAIPPTQVDAFFDRLVPSEADRAAAEALRSGDEETLRRTLEGDPGNAGVAAALARILLARREFDEAATLLEPFEFDFLGAGLAARARLQGEGDDLDAAFDAWDQGDHEKALEELQQALNEADPERRDPIRQVMVAIFDELGPSDPLAREYRKRLSAALY
ncbi:MAG: tetratricopeptide repeat protein [Thermoleophilaceae bacterium]